MRILFWGTPAYAVPSLQALAAAGHEIVGVVTQPDRRRGRGGARQPSPVREAAGPLGCPVITPRRIGREPELQERLQDLQADVSVVVAFGQLLPPRVLAQPRCGCWNGHGSLLPRWRGAAPIQWSILSGDRRTGVGVMAMEAGLDTGPVLLERAVPIGLLETATELAGRLSRLTAELLVEAMPLIEAAGPGSEAERRARLPLRPQDESRVTHARLLEKRDSHIHWQAPTLAVHRRVMALHPGATTWMDGRRLKILASEPLLESLADQLGPEAAALVASGVGAAPGRPAGTVLQLLPGVGPVVATADGALLIHRAQLEGKPAAGGERLLQQLRLRPGDRLQPPPGEAGAA